jgi:hypothetical protein
MLRPIEQKISDPNMRRKQSIITGDNWLLFYLFYILWGTPFGDSDLENTGAKEKGGRGGKTDSGKVSENLKRKAGIFHPRIKTF